MNSSTAPPVTRPSARPTESVARSLLGRHIRPADDGWGEDRNGSRHVRRPQWAAKEQAMTNHSYPQRPSAEQLLPSQPSATDFGSTPAMSRPSSSQAVGGSASAAANNITSQYRASHAQHQSLLERLLRQGGGISAADSAALARHKPISSDVFHEAVLAYLESTGRHDVVMAMLQDERDAQTAAPPAPSTGLDAPTSGANRLLSAASAPRRMASANHRSTSRGSASHSPGSAPSLPSHGAATLTRDDVAMDQPGTGKAAKAHTSNQRRSHDLLKKGLLETYAQWARESRPQHPHHGNSPNPSSAQARQGTINPRSTSATLQSSTYPRTTPVSPASSIVPSLSQVLPTLYGMPSSLRGDIALLHCDIEDKLRLQYEAYSLVPPVPHVLAQVGAQLRQPLWSAMDTAESLHLPPVRNHVTGNVVMGTMNQLVEELTHVYVTVSYNEGTAASVSPSDAQAAVDASFAESFFRQHRLFTPSSVLLAKLFERFNVPLSVKLGFERFEAHGITIHVEGGGRALPRERSQSETVVRFRAGADVAVTDMDDLPPVPRGDCDGPRRGNASEQTLQRSLSPPSDRFLSTGPTSTVAPPTRLVTHYSRSATLWLLVGEKIRTKVLSVLLMWIQRHPNHFDLSMIHSVLHFVEECCYEPTVWSDCATTLPQIAELLRDEAYSILQTLELEREAVRDADRRASGQPAAPRRERRPTEGIEVIEALRGTSVMQSLPFILSAFATDDRLKHLRAAVPPSLRTSLPRMPTWLSAAVTLPTHLLPSFAYRTDDVLGEDTTFRSLAVPAEAPAPAATLADQNRADPAALSPTRLHDAAERALECFGRFTMEEYVGALTVAHQLLFGLFPAQDLATLAEHTTAEYLSSRAVRESHLVVFLRTAADLTSWTVSLLLHAAFLDSERVSASMADASIVSSLLNAGDELTLPQPTVTHHGTSGTASSEASSGGEQGTPTRHGTDRASPRSAPASARGASTKLDPSTMLFVSTAESLLDLVVAFLRVNNVHASYAVFCGFCHPFVQRLLRHPSLWPVLGSHTLRRVAKLEQFYGLATRNEDVGGLGTEDTSASFVAHHFTQSMGASITSDMGIGGAHVLPDFLKAVSDSAEFPTIPAVPFHLRELRYAMTHEPTFLTTNCGDFPITKSTATGERCEPLVCVVNWRKLRIIDDITQRVNAQQTEALFYVSAKATVAHTLNENTDVERAFKEQLDEVIVTDVATLQAMANALLSVLQ